MALRVARRGTRMHAKVRARSEHYGAAYGKTCVPQIYTLQKFALINLFNSVPLGLLQLFVSDYPVTFYAC